MKILIIISGYDMSPAYIENIKIVDNFINTSDAIVEYAGISNQDDFKNYEPYISFKYKMINTNLQLSKICDFITMYKNEFDYDLYIKIRPDTKLLEPINFNVLDKNAINLRAYIYRGPKQIKYGCSTVDYQEKEKRRHSFYCDKEIEYLVDDAIYIFGHSVILNGGFESIPVDTMINNTARFNELEILRELDQEFYAFMLKVQAFDKQSESFHTLFWKCRKIPINIIGINILNTKHNIPSGHINI